MIALFSVAVAAPQVGAGRDEWSIGAMTSWRTTPYPQRWGPYGAPERTWLGGPALHLVGSWRALGVDLGIGDEYGAEVGARGWTLYSGFRVAARVGVTVVSTREPADRVDPIHLSVGAGVLGWAACCSATGTVLTTREGPRAPTSSTVFVANRLWLWEPLGLDLRYEIPLARGWPSTVEVGMVFARRE